MKSPKFPDLKNCFAALAQGATTTVQYNNARENLVRRSLNGPEGYIYVPVKNPLAPAILPLLHQADNITLLNIQHTLATVHIQLLHIASNYKCVIWPND